MSNGVKKKTKLKDYKKEIKVIWQYVLIKKKTLTKGIVFGLASAGIAAVIPYIYGRITDVAIFESNKFQIIVFLLFLWLFLGLVRDYFSRLVTRYAAQTAETINNEMRVDLAEHLINLPVAFHREKKMGKIIGRMARGVDRIGLMVENILFQVGPEILTFLLAAVILLLAEWHLALLILVVIFVYIFTTVKKIRPIIEQQNAIWKAWERAYGKMHEAISSAEIIKAYTAEIKEKKKHKSLFGKALNRFLKWLKSWISIDAWQNTTLSVGFVAVFATGIFLLINGKITPGKLIMFIGYFSLITGPLVQITWLYRQTLNTLVLSKRIFRIFGYKTEKEFAGARDYSIEGLVEFDKVNFKYEKKQAGILKDISFKVKSGQVVALVGESGVGKSTLISLISRYFLPQKGRISIDNRDIKKFTLRSLRSQIAIVPQEVVLFHDTVKNNIGYGRSEASQREIVKAAKIANAHKFVVKLPKKYNSVVGERGVKLSVGQKDRVGIARAVLKEPRILILDEPTSNLDPESERLIQESLKKIMKGRTTFIIAHRLSTVTNADKILVLEKGRLVEMGTHKQLIKKTGVYKRLYDLQMLK